MRHILVAMLILMAMAGCSRHGEMAAGAPPPPASNNKSADSPSQFMAYSRSIRIDVEESKVASVYEAAQAACREAVADQCVILGSNLNTGRDAYAEIKFRAKASGIQKLIAVLGAKGTVMSQSVTGEDLARPIQDSAKKLAMLSDYRSKLEALRGRASSDFDALIKVNKELAQVQSEIEAMTGERAHLVQRVETEILNVSISSTESRSFWRPVSVALSGFASNLSEGLSGAITGIAYIIPWSIVLLFFVWVGRKLWLRKKQPNTNV